ncbi:cutinase transcription factor 1 beta [Fusarium proliferatum]|uniref:Cutinase transcription factor 1 beta n=1 Tax=Gibberella intermedia TaxID=948311 RepID=A0A365N0U8_GIBIN|nr:cutinase transcription factor 1 beta [Fusarium proliferatum]
MRTEDIAYLKSRGAFTIPPAQIRNALLRSYFTYVHPFMPVIDMDEFLGAIECDGRNQNISFLLFQSVMFAGAACTPMCYLEKLGFNSRKEAREELFTRVRLLYDLDYETDGLALVQSLLLMTLWYKSPEEHRNTWHWLDVAISQAFAIGLHLVPDETLFSHTECSLRRKVWWSCYVTDRLISLNMKRPPRIRGDDFHVTPLLETDFQPNPPSEDCQVRLNLMCSYVSDTKLRSTLGRQFIELVCLCQLMDPILRLHRFIQLGENNRLLSCNPETTESCRFRLISTQKLSALKKRLKEWIDSPQRICNYKVAASSDFTSTGYLQQTALRLTSQAMMLQAHRLTILLSEQHDDDAEAGEANSGILDSARQISDLASEVVEKGLCSFLPAFTLGGIVHTTEIFLQNIMGPRELRKADSEERFMQCLEAIAIMEEIYEPARMARQAISWALVGPWNASKISSIEMNPAEVMLAHHSETPYSKGESSSPASFISHDTQTNTPSIATSLWSSDFDQTGELGTVFKAWGLIAKEEIMIEHQDAEIHEFSAISMEGLGVLNDLSLSMEFRRLSYDTYST